MLIDMSKLTLTIDKYWKEHNMIAHTYILVTDTRSN